MEINENKNKNKIGENKLSIITKNKEKEMKKILFARKELKLSNNLEDLNDKSFNISHFTYVSYSSRSKLSEVKNMKAMSFSNILMNGDENLCSFENATTYSIHNSKSKKSKSTNKSSNNVSKEISQNNINSKFKATKKVNFKQNFVDIIEIESYKKYNVNNYLKANCVNCSCYIF